MLSVQRKRLGLGALWLAGLLPLAAADEVAESGRAILAKNKDAVVTVQLVVRQQFSMPGRGSNDSEQKSEATGTVIDPTGLTVIALSEADPSSMMRRLMSGIGGPDGLDFKIESEIEAGKTRPQNGTETPAGQYMREMDLDLAFVLPRKKPTEPIAWVDFSDSGTAEVLDQVITLNRLGRVAGRVHSASVERIEAVVRRPRTFYIPGKDPTNTGLGSPAFTLDGKILGIFVMRAIRVTSGMDMQDAAAAIMIPAADVLEAAEQAPPFKDDADQ